MQPQPVNRLCVSCCFCPVFEGFRWEDLPLSQFLDPTDVCDFPAPLWSTRPPPSRAAPPPLPVPVQRACGQAPLHGIPELPTALWQTCCRPGGSLASRGCDIHTSLEVTTKMQSDGRDRRLKGFAEATPALAVRVHCQSFEKNARGQDKAGLEAQQTNLKRSKHRPHRSPIGERRLQQQAA